DAEGESALVRRLDLRIIPWIGLCYLFAYLDRSNIGNAVIAEGDMLGSLGIAPGSPEYSLALSIFFVGYLLFEIPSNILLKWATPSKWIARIMVTWGIVAACTAAVTNAAGLIAVRFFLGVAEAGFFPGVIYFFAFWYRQDEQARRISWFFGAVSLAGAFSGLLASAIGFLHGVGGLDAWQYLFIIEGVPSVILGILTIWMLPDFPGTGAKWFGREWLTPEEDALAASRMAEHAPKASDPAFDWIEFKELFSNPSRARTASTYLLPLIYFAFACGNYSISFYLPTVVLSLGSFQTWQAQLLTVPPYIVGFFAAISASWFSDRWAKVHGDEPTFKASRAWQLGLAFTLTLIGVSVWAAGVSGWAGYAAAFPLLAGNQAAVPIFWAYGAQHFFRGATGHSVGIAWVNSVGNLGGFAAPYFF
ncbi:major facilitator superfamily domain-containing protein, partial [Hyaloraphidium curvatum]